MFDLKITTCGAYTLTTNACGDITDYTITCTREKPVYGDEMTIAWSFPIVDAQYQWHPNCGFDRSFHADWARGRDSKISYSAPIQCLYNDADMNRGTFALDDCTTPITNAYGVREEDGAFVCKITIPMPVVEEYTVTLRADLTPYRYEKAIQGITAWWEKKYPPMRVPEAAKRPMYSAWYSLHQEVYAEDVLAECVKAKELGMDTIIIDDGWQTDDNNRGYGYCGDWELATGKIPDMAELVQKIHDIGMKVMLWYSVPFIGEHSKIIERFRDKILDRNEWLECYTLDPRYPDVRAYLIDVYVRHAKAWKLDGFKLDFIDSFRMTSYAKEYDEAMDYRNLEEAVQRLMIDVMKELTAISEDMLIEFRQSYIGPCMREFGNMFRVGDCPNTTNRNRVGIVDLRLMSGSTAVHTDMLMWHVDDRVENAVCQIQNGIFATEQNSARMVRISDEHAKAIKFWNGFMLENKELLQDAPIVAENPHMLYPMVYTCMDGKAIIGVYERNYAVTLPDAEDIIILNANAGKELLLRNVPDAEWKIEVYNCVGDSVRTENLKLSGLTALDVPECGFVRMCRL